MAQTYHLVDGFCPVLDGVHNLLLPRPVYLLRYRGETQRGHFTRELDPSAVVVFQNVCALLKGDHHAITQA